LKVKEEEKRKEVEVMKEYFTRKLEEASKKGVIDPSLVEEHDKQKSSWL